jgi:hypothetical protein
LIVEPTVFGDSRGFFLELCPADPYVTSECNRAAGLAAAPDHCTKPKSGSALAYLARRFTWRADLLWRVDHIPPSFGALP